MALSETFGQDVGWEHPYFEAHASGFLERYLAYIDDYIAHLEDTDPETRSYSIDDRRRYDRLPYPQVTQRGKGYSESDFFTEEQTRATLETYRDFRELLHGFMERIEQYEAPGRQMIEKALMLAIQAHQGKLNRKGELRKSDGAPYIKHPIEMAVKGMLSFQLLYQRVLPAAAIVAILLHDTVEDARLGPVYPEAPEEWLVQPPKDEEQNALPDYQPLNTRQRWLVFIRREFNHTEQGEQIATWVDGVSEVEPTEAERLATHASPLFKIFKDYFERGGTKVSRARSVRELTPGEKSERKLESVIFNLERLFRILLEDPNNAVIAVIKILDIWHNFDDPELIDPIKVLRGRIAANLAEMIGWPDMRAELVTRLAQMIDITTPYAPGTFPEGKAPLEVPPTSAQVAHHLLGIDGSYSQAQPIDDDTHRERWYDLWMTACKSIDTALPNPDSVPVNAFPGAAHRMCVGPALTAQSSGELPVVEFTVLDGYPFQVTDLFVLPGVHRAGEEWDHDPSQQLDDLRRFAGRECLATLFASGHRGPTAIVRFLDSQPTIMLGLGKDQSSMLESPEANLLWPFAGLEQSPELQQIQSAHGLNLLHTLYTPGVTGGCYVVKVGHRVFMLNPESPLYPITQQTHKIDPDIDPPHDRFVITAGHNPRFIRHNLTERHTLEPRSLRNSRRHRTCSEVFDPQDALITSLVFSEILETPDKITLIEQLDRLGRDLPAGHFFARALLAYGGRLSMLEGMDPVIDQLASWTAKHHAEMKYDKKLLAIVKRRESSLPPTEKWTVERFSTVQEAKRTSPRVGSATKDLWNPGDLESWIEQFDRILTSHQTMSPTWNLRAKDFIAWIREIYPLYLRQLAVYCKAQSDRIIYPELENHIRPWMRAQLAHKMR